LWWTGAAARFSLGLALDEGTVDFALSVRGRNLPTVDEVLELFLVLVDPVIGLVAQHAPVLDEVLESGASVPAGAESELASRLGGRKRASPAQQIEQLR